MTTLSSLHIEVLGSNHSDAELEEATRVLRDELEYFPEVRISQVESPIPADAKAAELSFANRPMRIQPRAGLQVAHRMREARCKGISRDIREVPLLYYDRQGSARRFGTSAAGLFQERCALGIDRT